MTVYNGTKACARCGGQITPVQAMIDKKHCPPCRREVQAAHVKGRMA